MDVRVDRLTLQGSGLSEPDSRRLVRLLGEALADAPPASAPTQLSRLVVDVEQQPDETLESTARRLAVAVRQASARAL